jgi:hypothetical protein
LELLHLCLCTNIQQYRSCCLDIRRKKSESTQLLTVAVQDDRPNKHTHCLIELLPQLLLRKHAKKQSVAQPWRVQIFCCSWYHPVILCTDCYVSKICQINYSNIMLVFHQLLAAHYISALQFNAKLYS